MSQRTYQPESASETKNFGADYAKVVIAFLDGGIDELFDFVENNAKIRETFSGFAKARLRESLRAQHNDAMAYRAVVKLAHDAGVPLFNPYPNNQTIAG